MSIAEKLTGRSRVELQEHDWPSPRSIKFFFWPPSRMLRGSIRLIAKRVIDQEGVDRRQADVDRRLDAIDAEVLKLL